MATAAAPCECCDLPPRDCDSPELPADQLVLWADGVWLALRGGSAERVDELQAMATMQDYEQGRTATRSRAACAPSSRRWSWKRSPGPPNLRRGGADAPSTGARWALQLASMAVARAG